MKIGGFREEEWDRDLVTICCWQTLVLRVTCIIFLKFTELGGSRTGIWKRLV